MGELEITIMKRCILLLISVFFISSFTNAQYRINKTKYDYCTYSHQVGDRYNPTVAGIASFIPGLGQALSGEAGRGATFFEGFAGCFGVTAYGAYVGLNSENGAVGTQIMLTGMAGMLAVDVWAIIDAVRVAKVNNLAWRDKNKTPYNLQVQPYINKTYYNKNGSIPDELTLKVTF
jgi:hypothetical protein